MNRLSGKYVIYVWPAETEARAIHRHTSIRWRGVVPVPDRLSLRVRSEFARCPVPFPRQNRSPSLTPHYAPPPPSLLDGLTCSAWTKGARIALTINPRPPIIRYMIGCGFDVLHRSGPTYCCMATKKDVQSHQLSRGRTHQYHYEASCCARSVHANSYHRHYTYSSRLIIVMV